MRRYDTIWLLIFYEREGREELLVGANEFAIVQAEVKQMINNRMLVDHSIQNDLRALKL